MRRSPSGDEVQDFRQEEISESKCRKARDLFVATLFGGRA
jgi:hypothetical protein